MFPGKGSIKLWILYVNKEVFESIFLCEFQIIGSFSFSSIILAQPDHDPNTVHCLCGADADLIMLGLATHEPHFYIIREEFKTNMDRPCDVCGRTGKMSSRFGVYIA